MKKKKTTKKTVNSHGYSLPGWKPDYEPFPDECDHVITTPMLRRCWDGMEADEKSGRPMDDGIWYRMVLHLKALCSKENIKTPEIEKNSRIYVRNWLIDADRAVLDHKAKLDKEPPLRISAATELPTVHMSAKHIQRAVGDKKIPSYRKPGTKPHLVKESDIIAYQRERNI